MIFCLSLHVHVRAPGKKVYLSCLLHTGLDGICGGRRRLFLPLQKPNTALEVRFWNASWERHFETTGKLLRRSCKLTHRQFSKEMERKRAFQRTHRTISFSFNLETHKKCCWTKGNSRGKDLACKKQETGQRELLPNPFILIQSFPAHLDFCLL